MPPHPAKTALRAALRARRASVSAASVEVASSRLVDAVLAHASWRSARGVAAFVGVRGEPNTRPLLDAALAQGRRLWLPRVVDAAAGQSVLVEVTDLASQLATAPFGLLEPVEREGEQALSQIDEDAPNDLDLDLVLVPGLAFDHHGARIGFGPGHYDRLLAPVADRSHPVRIGVCLQTFFDPPEGPIPTEPHDVPMHYIATETGVHECAPA